MRIWRIGFPGIPPPPPPGEKPFNPTETLQYQNMFLERKFVE